MPPFNVRATVVNWSEHPLHDPRQSESRKRRSPRLPTDQINGKYRAEGNFSWFEATTLGNCGDKGRETDAPV